MTFVSTYNLQSLVRVCWLLFLYSLNVYHSVFSIYNSGRLLRITVYKTVHKQLTQITKEGMMQRVEI